MKVLLMVVLLVMPFSQVFAEISFDGLPDECEAPRTAFLPGGRYATSPFPFIVYTINNGFCLAHWGGHASSPATIEILLAGCDDDYIEIGYPSCTFFGVDNAINYYNPSTTTRVQSTTGTSFSITPTDAGVLTTSGTIPDIGALLTLDNSSTTIQRNDGSILEIKQKAIATLNPESISIVRGEVTATLACNYEVRTALATITSCPTTKKAADSAKFTTDYSQSGLDGTLNVTVEAGTVDIVDREGNTHTVTAGNEKTITSRVPRAQWVLPIDEDKLYGGKDNFLIWTQFPNAASYMMEFNLPSPVFAENNVSAPQFTKQVVPLPAGSYAEFEGLALLTLPLPKGADGLVLELRIFALDVVGNIIGESVSSDSAKATLVD